MLEVLPDVALRAVRADRRLHHGARSQRLRAEDRFGGRADRVQRDAHRRRSGTATFRPGTVGEIVGRSPLMMPGYHKRPDLTAQAMRDGWLFTGDLGMADDDGYLHLVDRKKDLIISGGVNVYPEGHRGDRRAARRGARSRGVRRAEREVGRVAGRGGRAARARHARRRTISKRGSTQRVAARYQQLSEVMIVDDLPRSTAGKTLKRVLREQYASPRRAVARTDHHSRDVPPMSTTVRLASSRRRSRNVARASASSICSISTRPAKRRSCCCTACRPTRTRSARSFSAGSRADAFA